MDPYRAFRSRFRGPSGRWAIIAVMPIILILAACAPVLSPAAEPATEGLRPIAVADVSMEIGVGSPIPVDAFVSGGWPDLCAQLAEMTVARDGFQFDISLLATAADPTCPPDFVGLPFRIAIPINVVELPEGTYTVTVNGASDTFDWPPAQ